MTKMYILSYKRSDVITKESKTLSFVPAYFRSNVVVVVRQEEEQDYKRVLRDSVDILIIPTKTIKEAEKIRGRPYMYVDTMDFIIDKAKQSGEDHAIICDDDLSLACKDSVSSSLRKLEDKDWDRLQAYLETSDYDTPVKAPSFRGFNSAKITPVERDTQVTGFFSLYMPFFRESNICFCGTKAVHMPDRHFILALLYAGKHVEVTNMFVHNDKANTKGGCSVNRSQVDHSTSALELARQYPEVVSVKVKTNLGDTRVATTILWKKAFGLGDRHDNI